MSDIVVEGCGYPNRCCEPWPCRYVCHLRTSFTLNQ